jgi:Fungal specific transcription factor domain
MKFVRTVFDDINVAEISAVLHCVLAMAAGIDLVRGYEKTDSQQLMKHLSSTYRCINRNLQQSEIPSEATIAAVMSLAIHEDLLRQQERRQVHMKALYKMIDMRGGLESFAGHDLLLRKLCR